MKSLEEILSDPRINVNRHSGDGGHAQVWFIGSNKPMTIVYSNGGGWDHVSASYPSRTPTWDEMCFVKNLFFAPEEVAVEYHPPKSEYKNLHPNCLHVWRPQAAEMPTPPIWFV